ncbi:hypothetical protein GCM10027416_18720 [Okibacterium endophyticum]
MATAPLVLGLVAILIGITIPIPFFGLVSMFFAFIPAVLAVVFGAIGMKRTHELNGLGMGTSIAGIILGGITLVISIVVTFFWILAMAASSASGIVY